MLDEIEPLLIFVVACWPANLLHLALHEAGHVIAGRCVGFQIFAAGIGIARPRWSSALATHTSTSAAR